MFSVNLKRALYLFGYNSLIEVDLKNLKKKYREVVKKVHPDISNKDSNIMVQYNLAYDIIRNCIEQIEHQNKKAKSNVLGNLITLEELIKVLENKNLANKYSQLENKYIKIVITIESVNLSEERVFYVKFNYKNVYYINLGFRKDDTVGAVTLKIADKSIDITLEKGNKAVRFEFDCGLTIYANII